jgi:hypothetical protein
LKLTGKDLHLLLNWYKFAIDQGASMSEEEDSLQDRILDELESWRVDDAETPPDQPEAQAEAGEAPSRVLKDGG